jgi:hypothetical protein
MHRQLLGVTDPEIDVDHADRNGLNNQRYNLRATPDQNPQNAKIRIDNTSGFKGVSKSGKKWRVQISVHGKYFHIGYTTNKLDAARLYNEAAAKYFGEFAVLNQLEAL